MRRNGWIVAGLAAALLGACAVQAPGSAPQGGSRPLVLVAGATGGTGHALVDQALAAGYRVRVLVRDEDKARGLFGNRVAYAVGDVRNARPLRSAVRGADYVVSALGSNTRRDPENSPELVDYGGVKALAEAARDAGVRHFVLVSSMGVTHPDHPLNRMFDDILVWKLRGEDALRASGVPYTIVRPGGLTNDPGGRLALEVMQGDPRDVTGRISRADLATLLVNALGRESASGRTFEVVSGDAPATEPEWDALFGRLAPDAPR
jgi:uncharacterized protein YbjT (DUF2867 family)